MLLGFPACPIPAVDAGTNACGAHACDGLASTDDAKVCPDGTGVGRSVCAKNASGACFWDFPACPTPTADAGSCGCVPDMKWGLSGGLATYGDESRLTSCTRYQRVRDFRDQDRPTLSCEETLPKCAFGLASGQLITVALDRPDVKAALQAAPILYGVDPRPYDGQVFRIQVGTSVIEVGDACGATAACTPIPAGVQQLVNTLKIIDNQELSMTPCATMFHKRNNALPRNKKIVPDPSGAWRTAVPPETGCFCGTILFSGGTLSIVDDAGARDHVVQCPSLGVDDRPQESEPQRESRQPVTAETYEALRDRQLASA